METAVREGKYIYCIIAAEEPKAFGPLGIGERQDELYTISYDGIAAVVSNAPIKNYPISRENTIAHEKAIEEVMKAHVVLPVRFATIAEDEKKVKKILKEEYDRFKDLLEKFKDRKELGLKAVFKEAIYEYILEKRHDIKQLKTKIGMLPSEKSYFQRMEIGRIVEKALGEEREIYREDILNVLKPLVEDTKINALYGERMIVNAAFLINKDRETEFDEAIQGLDARYASLIKFKYVGTIPPFNFVNLAIETGSY